MKNCKIELGISPLSSNEVEQVLAAVRAVWHSPSCIKRHACNGAWLLTLRHEAPHEPEESSTWFAEKLVAAIWQAIGRYARITLLLDTQQKDEPILQVLDERDYLRILRNFRFSRTNTRI